MKTIVLNGSPKGNAPNSNTRIFCEEFVRNMSTPCEIQCIANTNPEMLSHYVEDFDTIIIILPLYIHAMPGVLMKFIEHLRPCKIDGKSLGFIIQAGFIETEQQIYLARYFEILAKQLHYQYLGTVCKGEAAAIYMFPRMFKKVLRLLNNLGTTFEETQVFNPKIVKELGKPYRLSKGKARIFQLLCDLGLNNIGWHRELKRNNAYHKRLDRPFL